MLRHHAYLLTTFRNGWALSQELRGGPCCEGAILRDGTRIGIPHGRGGIAETVIALWYEEMYTQGGFYRPAADHVIVDAGANVGFFSIWALRLNPKCRVTCLEPFPENFSCLKANLKDAGFESTRVFQIAVGGEDGWGKMREGGRRRTLEHQLVMGETSASHKGVCVVSLQSIFRLAQAERIDLLKMNIEGAEREAFAAASPETMARIDRLAIEYHDNLRPGTLRILQERLAPTHEMHFDSGREHIGWGILQASRRAS